MSILVFGVMALYQNKGIKMCDKGKCAVQRREGAYNGIAQNLKYEIACLFDRETCSSFNHFSNRTDRLYEGRIDG